MKILTIIIMSLLISATTYAGTPVIYSKTLIKIIPKQSQTNSETVKKDSRNASDSKISDMLPTLKRTAKEFSVEIRPISFLSQKDFISNQPFTDREGMMIMVESPQILQLKASSLFGKVDVLFVTEDGKILDIMPNITISDLTDPISSEKPIKAFIFLQNNMTKTSDIKTGDIIENAIFKSHPTILQ